jgi:hypothetical protein
MKKQIVRISVLQSAKVAAALYLVISIPMGMLMLTPALMGQSQGPGFSVITLLVMPVMYTVFGFIFTMIAAGVYNLVARHLGGFEFTTVEVADD